MNSGTTESTIPAQLLEEILTSAFRGDKGDAMLSLDCQANLLVQSLDGRLLAQEKALEGVKELCDDCCEHNLLHFSSGNPVLQALADELPRVREDLVDLASKVRNIMAKDNNRRVPLPVAMVSSHADNMGSNSQLPTNPGVYSVVGQSSLVDNMANFADSEPVDEDLMLL